MMSDKQLRQMSVEGLTPMAKGANGVVYRLDSDKIIKVINNRDDFEEIEREFNNSKIAMSCGIPTAKAYELVRVDDSYGAIYELFTGSLLGSHLMQHPGEADSYIDKFTELALQLHHTSGQGLGLVTTKEIFHSRVNRLGGLLSEEDLGILRGVVDSFPDRDTLVHGDYHTKNIMLKGDELMLIDLGNLSLGHPMIDLGQTYSVLVTYPSSFAASAQENLAVDKEMAARVWDRFFEKYAVGLDGWEKDMVIAYGRLFSTFDSLFLMAADPRMKVLFYSAFAEFKKNAEAMTELIKYLNTLF